jgi:hypothetical protein
MAKPGADANGEGAKPERPAEREAVHTTIVGGRPPGCGTEVGNIPRGIEILVKKAAVDLKFRKLLLEKRAGAAEEIKLELEPAEAAMLTAIPAAQLDAIIAGTKVDEKVRPAFLGRVAAIMIAALGAGVLPSGCSSGQVVNEDTLIRGSSGRRIRLDGRPVSEDEATVSPDARPISLGIRPDKPRTTHGIRPDRPNIVIGSR